MWKGGMELNFLLTQNDIHLTVAIGGQMSSNEKTFRSKFDKAANSSNIKDHQAHFIAKSNFFHRL
jgi:hypothetical protein